MKPKDVFSFEAGNDGQMRDIARRHPRGERRHELQPSRGMPPSATHLPAMSLDLDLTLAGSIMGWDIVHTGELGAETFQRLLGEGVNVDEQSPGGTTALEFACAFGNETLLASGARRDRPSDRGGLSISSTAARLRRTQRVDTHPQQPNTAHHGGVHGHAEGVQTCGLELRWAATLESVRCRSARHRLSRGT